MRKFLTAVALLMLVTMTTNAASKPNVPQLTAPKNQSSFAVNATPTLKWKTTNAANYLLEVYAPDGALFFSASVVKSQCINNLCSVQVTTPLTVEGMYKWRVTATNVAGSTPSKMRNFGVYPASTIELLKMVNTARCNRGLAPLALNVKLTQAATRHTLDMANNMVNQNPPISHYGTDGSDPIVRANQAGYSSPLVWENIAAGQQTTREVFQAWMKSPGHRANMLNPDLREMGVALYRTENAPYSTYWTQDFGKRGGTVLGTCPR